MNATKIQTKINPADFPWITEIEISNNKKPVISYFKTWSAAEDFCDRINLLHGLKATTKNNPSFILKNKLWI